MKRALIVGINKYQDPADNLRGCVNDAINMRNTLLKFGFKKDDIRLVLDERATFDGIISRLDWLLKNTKKGDAILFHYSGHGAQIRDRDGDELADHLDEILCPHDMDWDRPLSDDILKTKFQMLPKGANMYLVFDCCHSGTLVRNSSVEGQGYNKPRRLIPPADIAARSDERELPVHKVGFKNQSLKWWQRFCPCLRKFQSREMPQQRHVMMSGCRDDQTSADAHIGGDYNGAFTWNLINEINRTPKHPIEDIFRRTVKQVKHHGFSQVPQWSCPKWLGRYQFVHEPREK